MSRPEVLVESVAREGRSAYRLVVQVGAAAAAIASIVGLVLPLANLWSGGGTKPAVPLRVTVGKPEVHITTFKDYLTEHGRKHVGIPESVLATKVVAVDYRATAAHAPTKTTYPLRLTLLKPRDDGALTAIAQKQGTRLDTGIDSGTDRTIGDEYFDHLPGPGLYRLRIDVVSAADRDNVLDSRSIDFTYR